MGFDFLGIMLFGSAVRCMQLLKDFVSQYVTQFCRHARLPHFLEYLCGFQRCFDYSAQFDSNSSCRYLC